MATKTPTVEQLSPIGNKNVVNNRRYGVNPPPINAFIAIMRLKYADTNKKRHIVFWFRAYTSTEPIWRDKMTVKLDSHATCRLYYIRREPIPLATNCNLDTCDIPENPE